MEELIIGGSAPQKHSVWDNYVPILQSARHTDIYLTDQIESPSEYNQVCHLLRTAYKEDTFTLHLNNGGGYVDSGFMLIDAIKASKGKVTAKLSGTVASVSTIIALRCAKIEMADYLQFMIHNYSGGASGKGHEMRAQLEFTNSQLNFAFKDVYNGFLTDHEMELVIAGKDIWLSKDEVQQRLDARKAGDTEKLEELATLLKERTK